MCCRTHRLTLEYVFLYQKGKKYINQGSHVLLLGLLVFDSVVFRVCLDFTRSQFAFIFRNVIPETNCFMVNDQNELGAENGKRGF
ncbi:hypothetical protein RIF29_17280 [Crotalaria pallida]|uniref:Uncharacterized protein n=1 Tax=Crotalaria pallida TaxID=3830 RepID=A0AAN9FGT4_CROPI